MAVDEKLVAASAVYNQARCIRRMGRERGEKIATDGTGKSGGLGSRERCYQHDEGARRSLRIIGSYDCLSRAPAICDCKLPWVQLFASTYQLTIAPSAISTRRADGITSGGQPCAPLKRSFREPESRVSLGSLSPVANGVSHYNKDNKLHLSTSGVA